MKNKTKLYGTILGVVLFTLLVAGFTYAALNWESTKTNIKLTSGCFDIYYDKGQDISGQLNPSSSYTDGLFATIKINIKNSCTTNGTGTLYLETLNTTSSNLYRTGLLNYQVVKDDVATNLKGNITKSGEIALDIGTLTKASSASTTYKIYVWVNKDLLINSDANSKYYGKIRATATQGKRRFLLFYFIPKSSSSTSICFNISSVVVNPDITLYNPSCNIVITSLLYTRLLSSSFLIPALIASLIS